VEKRKAEEGSQNAELKIWRREEEEYTEENSQAFKFTALSWVKFFKDENYHLNAIGFNNKLKTKEIAIGS